MPHWVSSFLVFLLGDHRIYGRGYLFRSHMLPRLPKFRIVIQERDTRFIIFVPFPIQLERLCQSSGSIEQRLFTRFDACFCAFFILGDGETGDGILKLVSKENERERLYYYL